MVARILIASALLLGACEKRSEKYCANNPDDLANCEQTDAAPPEPVACMTDTECSGGYCELGAHVCVECLDDGQCTVGEHCDIANGYRCRGCVSDADCPGASCMPGGMCADDSTVVYVDAGGTDNETCGFSTKCATLDHGLTLVSDTRKVLKLSGALTEAVVIAKSVDIVAAPGTTLSGPGQIIMDINSGPVSIFGLGIVCNGDQDGIDVDKSTLYVDGVEVTGCDHEAGIDVHMGFTTIRRSLIHDNPAGGIRTDGAADFAITNNFIHHNGGTTGFGIKLGTSDTRPEKLEFNTIVANAVGLTCAKATTAPNNIISGNGTLLADVVTCNASGSLTAEQIPLLAFKSTVEPYDYHIGATSSARDTATVPTTIDDDYDGDLRPQGTKNDFGADEYRAP